MKKTFALFLIFSLWWGRSLLNLKKEILDERARLSEKLDIENIKTRSFQEKFFVLQNSTDQVVGKIISLFSTGKQNSYFLEGQLNYFQGEVLDTFRFDLSVHSDGENTISHFLLTLRPSDLKSYRCQGSFDGKEWLLNFISGHEKLSHRFPVRGIFQLQNPLYPLRFSLGFPIDEKKSIPKTIRFVDPLSMKLISISVRELRKWRIIDGVKSKEVILEFKPFPCSLYLSEEGELMGLEFKNKLKIFQISSLPKKINSGIKFPNLKIFLGGYDTFKRSIQKIWK